ncbi:hypothetical protein L915_00748 [Phytophthora nicotianae]|uniref:Uncharacterized protein n=1 Tax=Phytophthora nicotianae TaxID=4792 RepID=W2HMV4_PHYNI|nr:hypothetical protein L915_00748 [Phytophthora nicotianae]
MHFKEASEMSCLEDGSTNVNFSSGFSPSATLPGSTIQCSSYDDILDGIHGLNALGQEVWFDYMRKLASRLRTFVCKNKSADPSNTPTHVRANPHVPLSTSPPRGRWLWSMSRLKLTRMKAGEGVTAEASKIKTEHQLSPVPFVG